jgi:dTDP-4-dehydrorhamnose reductase
MQTIVITGSNGFLAMHLCAYFKKYHTNYIIYGIVRDINKNLHISKSNCLVANIANKKEVDTIFSTVNPAIIIHAAAMSKPDTCLQQPVACIENNVLATAYLAEAAKKYGTKLIYISTDFIYGDDGPHNEETIPQPLNFYGESKLMAEKIIEATGVWHSIVRPVFIYGSSNENMKPSFLHWVKNNIENNKPIKVVNDQYRTPTYVYDICYAIATIIEKDLQENFGIAGAEICTPYDVAIAVANYLQLNSNLITPVTAATFKEPVVRAKKGGLLSHKANRLLHFNPTNLIDGIAKTFTIINY